MIYNVLWSNKSFGGAEIYVRKMKSKQNIQYISLEDISLLSFLYLLVKLLNFRNTFIYHDTKASLISLIRFYYFKDYFVLHGPGKNPKRTKFLFRIFGLYAKKIILVSAYIYTRLPSSKFIVLENHSTFSSKCNKHSKEFIYFGRIVESKGVHTLCDTWSKLNNPTKLHIIGDGSLLSALKEKYKSETMIKFYGALAQEEIADIIKNCGFYVSFSPREGTSLSLSEAISTGLIPIVTNIPTQQFIKDELGIKLIKIDYSNSLSLIKYYLNIADDSKANLHKNIEKYASVNNQDKLNNFWEQTFKGNIK